MAFPESGAEQDMAKQAQLVLMQLNKPYYCGGSLDIYNVWMCGRGDPAPQPFSFPINAQRLRDLESLCDPATFGKGSKDILDPEYRSALALSADKFFTDFDKHLPDIISTIKTVLKPEAAVVRAELYKLNVYRAGDFFKSHVDTPRGNGMFGSLVVCLPQQHKGGELLVRHEGKEQCFDWSSDAHAAVQWAAFYSDCEHEILPVESGHRVTLTYNLYAVDKLDGPYVPGLETDAAGLRDIVAAALRNPTFMPRGGAIGYPCKHSYPHSEWSMLKQVPSMLKAEDALCFYVFTKLGLEVKLQALWDLSDAVETAKYNSDYSSDDGDSSDDGLRLSGFETSDREDGADLRRRLKRRTDIMWLTKDFKYKEQAPNSEYTGNDGCESWYSAAVILAEVPAWGNEARNKVMVSV